MSGACSSAADCFPGYECCNATCADLAARGLPSCFYISTSSTSALEGNAFLLNFHAVNYPDGSEFAYDFVYPRSPAASPADFLPGSDSGTVTLQDEQASLLIQTVDEGVDEPTEYFTVRFKENLPGGGVAIRGEIELHIVGTLASYAVRATNGTTFTEGQTIQAIIETDNVPNGTALGWSVGAPTPPGPSQSASSADFTPSSGSVTIQGGQATLSFQAVDELVIEPNENFTIKVTLGGSQVAQSYVYTLANAAGTWAVAHPNGITQAVEGSSFPLRVTTQNVQNGTPFTWSVINGTTIAADFDLSPPSSFTPSGSGTIQSGVANFSVPILADRFTEGLETFTVQIRHNNAQVALSPTFSVFDLSTTPPGVITCGTAAASGGIAQTTQFYAVGEAGGFLRVHYDVGSLADRFRFYYGDAATPFYDTGFITGSGFFDIAKMAGYRTIRVFSEGADANTRWCYTLMCVNDFSTPPACNPFA